VTVKTFVMLPKALYFRFRFEVKSYTISTRLGITSAVAACFT